MTIITVEIVTKPDGTATVVVTTKVDGEPATMLNLTAGSPEPK